MSRDLKSWIKQCGTIGDKPSDTEKQKLYHHFLIYMALMMSGAGILWGSLFLYHELLLPSSIPFGYALLTLVNLWYFSVSKQFQAVRFIQILLSLLLPFFFQWSIGGFKPSGAVMLWAMIALLGSLTFQERRLTRLWFLVYLFLTVISGVIDSHVAKYTPPISSATITLLFVINICGVSVIVFGLMNFFVRSRELVHQELESKNEALEVRNQFIRDTFGRYLTDEVVESILESPEGLSVGGDTRKVTILLSDIRGFSTLSEGLPPQQVVTLINTHLSVMTDIIQKYGGTIDEFLGDGILVIFGAPIFKADDAQRAVACAVKMQLAMEAVNAQNHRNGLPSIAMGIGINTGEVVVGNIGSVKRAKYGVVGNHVNLTARIESYTKGGQILVSEATLLETNSIVKVHQSMEIEPKGFTEKMTIYEVSGVSGEYNLFL